MNTIIYIVPISVYITHAHTYNIIIITIDYTGKLSVTQMKFNIFDIVLIVVGIRLVNEGIL